MRLIPSTLLFLMVLVPKVSDVDEMTMGKYLVKNYSSKYSQNLIFSFYIPSGHAIINIANSNVRQNQLNNGLNSKV